MLFLLLQANRFKYAGLILEGAIVVMISHAFVSSAMFAGVGYLYDRMHTRRLADFGGIVNTMPMFASFFMLFAMANAGLPGTSGFVGEFMVILGQYESRFLDGILGCYYINYWLQLIPYGCINEYFWSL